MRDPLEIKFYFAYTAPTAISPTIRLMRSNGAITCEFGRFHSASTSAGPAATDRHVHGREASGVLMGNENLEGPARVDLSSAKPSEPRNPASNLLATVVNDFTKDANLLADDRDDVLDGSVTRPILAVIVATVVLYFGKDFLLPLAMASILAVAFSPITSRLETLVGRFVSAALVVVLAISTIGIIGFFLTVELTSVAVEVAGYSHNIAAKLARLQGSTPAWLQAIEH